METVTCEPDYANMFRRFVDAIPTETRIVERYADTPSLEAFQSLTYVITVALMAVHSQESLDELREAVSDANKSLLKQIHERQGY